MVAKKKILGSVIALSLLSSFSFADENSGIFLGVEAGIGYSTFKDKNSNLPTGADIIAGADIIGGGPDLTKNPISDAGFDGALKLGYRFNPDHRLYLSVGMGHRASKETKIDITASGVSLLSGNYDVQNSTTDILVGYDFTPSLTDGIRGLFGVYVGHSSLKTELEQKGDLFLGGESTKQNFSGFAYGVKAGTIFDINENNEIDLSLRYTQRTYSEKVLDSDDPTSKVKPETSDVGIYIGYAYKF